MEVRRVKELCNAVVCTEMNKNSILFQGVTPEELLEAFSNLLDKHLKENKVGLKKENRYLTRKNVAQLLSISLPTVHDWVNKGILKSYRAGNRVYFKSEEVEESLKRIDK